VSVNFPPAGSNEYDVLATLTANDGVDATEPWVIPPEYQPHKQTTPGTITVQVPGVGGAKAGSFTPSSCDNPDFTVASVSTGEDGTAVVDAENDVWDAGATARSTLAANFADPVATSSCDLWTQLEALEDSQVLAMGGAFTVVQRVAEALPLPYGEILGYRYGFDPQGRYVDLQPGMSLRVEAATGEFAGPGQQAQFSGFVGSGASRWMVSRRRLDQALVFDAFVGALAPYAPMTTQGGAWGVVELQAAGAFRYYRLLYPPTEFGAWPGYAGTLENVALVGAEYRADIAAATTAYVGGQPVPSQGRGAIGCTYFRGRTLVVPELPVILQGMPFYAPVGATLRQLTEWLMPPGVPLPDIYGINRIWSPMDIRGQTPWLPVDVPADGTWPSGVDTSDLPLIKGDAVQLASSGPWGLEAGAQATG
jgi:hypothetical protein